MIIKREKKKENADEQWRGAQGMYPPNGTKGEKVSVVKRRSTIYTD